MRTEAERLRGGSLKKDNIRDYATEAFRFYAACGKLTSAELEQMVRNRIYQQSKREFLRSGSGVPFSPTEYAAMKAEDAVRDLQAEMMDIIAVEKTLKRLNQRHRSLWKNGKALPGASSPWY